jgi:MFS superfamily sulfate permease-like transporter
MAANVISGVGFVGAGVITTTAHQRQNVVHGLTTAATIWLSAAVGVACGVGLSRIATTAAITTLVILRLGRKKQINRQHNQNQDAAMLSSSPGLQVIVGAEDHLDEDEVLNQTEHHEANNADDIDSEIHLTGVWDEHHHSISSSPEQQFEDTAEQQQRRGRQHEQVMGRDPHTTYADNLWHAQQKSNLQNQERRKRKQPKEQEDTKYDNIQELVIDETEDFNAYPPQLLDAAGTYQVYKLDSTSYDFGYVNEQSGRKKVIHSARTDNRQDYQP